MYTEEWNHSYLAVLPCTIHSFMNVDSQIGLQVNGMHGCGDPFGML